ncbi:MAG: hypothetical protein SFU57_06515 [Gemmatimonadales bacterium]|nr:hypothetical protein [Gemmatimonadales bacterium]
MARYSLLLSDGGAAMLSVYLLSAILGVGLLIFSSLGGGDHGADLGDGLDTDTADLGDTGDGGAGQILLGLFSTRNLTFFLAAFGVGGLMLHYLGVATSTTLVVAAGLGAAAMGLSHALFTWLKRTDAAVEIFGDADFSGMLARVVLPISAGERGQIACTIAGREMYLTAQLDASAPAALRVGDEVIVLHADAGVATVMAASQIDQSPFPES